MAICDPADAGLTGEDAQHFQQLAARLERDPQVERALWLAAHAHREQRDRAGRAYILHPLLLATNADDTEQRCVALLHDVLEDTPVTAAQLTEAGFSSRIVRAVQCLSRDANEDYSAFIKRVARDRLASRVKLLDLAHNSDLSRLPGPPLAQDLARVEKYRQASERLYAELQKRNLYISLDPATRGRIAARASLPIVKSEHVTLAYRVAPTADLSPYLQEHHQIADVLKLRAVAECADDRVQAWVVELDGSACRKLDGATLHLTVSRSHAARSRDANELLRRGERRPLQEIFSGRLEWADD